MILSDGTRSVLTASHADLWLWETGQHQAPCDRPNHRTRTMAY
jgi:hypothetical protein